jgi:hypothetical protein
VKERRREGEKEIREIIDSEGEKGRRRGGEGEEGEE